LDNTYSPLIQRKQVYAFSKAHNKEFVFGGKQISASYIEAAIIIAIFGHDDKVPVDGILHPDISCMELVGQ
jgi:hypothetical protein